MGDSSSNPLSAGGVPQRLFDNPDAIPRRSTVQLVDGVLRLDGYGPSSDFESADGTVRASIRMNPDASGSQIGLRANGDVRYFLTVHPRSGQVVLSVHSKEKNLQNHKLSAWPLARRYEPNEWLRLELRAVGDRLTAFADGKELGSVQDQTITTAGKVTVYAQANGYFRDIEYVPLDGAGPSASAIEPWQDVLRDPAALPHMRGAERTPEGLRISAGSVATHGYRDAAIRMRARFDPVVRPQVQARMGGEGNYHLRVNSNAGKEVRLDRYESSAKTTTTLRIFPLRQPLVRDAEYELELRAVGSTLTVKLNGEVLGSVTDSTWTTGALGVGHPSEDGTAGALITGLEILNLDAPAAAASAPTPAEPWQDVLRAPDATFN